MTAGPYTAIPMGWYCIGFSGDVAAGAVRAVRVFGEELALYRTRAGVPRLTTAWCPHLGAHLGHSGAVQGETLRCRFHGFRFDGGGRCVATTYGHKPPPAAKLRAYPVREHAGLLFAWFHPDGEAPRWDLPALDLEGWSRPRTSLFSLRGHPQETSENSVDLGHFTVVHGFASGEQAAALRTEGPVLRIQHRVVASAASLGLPPWGRVDVHLDLELSGLGVSLVHGHLPRLGMTTRQLVLATPVDASHIELRLWSQARAGWLQGLLGAFFHLGFAHEVRQGILGRALSQVDHAAVLAFAGFDLDVSCPGKQVVVDDDVSPARAVFCVST